MKDRLKKFLTDHEKEVNAAAFGAIVTAVLYTVVSLKAIDNMRIEHVRLQTNEDTTAALVTICQKSGFSSFYEYTKPPEG